ncbi:PIN domain-containing protein [Mesorhizobium sp. M0046]|uniref:PIN domain-containing protein n=1 Tax=Mesorhizobium sp. M0046 TaxID=2956858 RepID=UPI003338429E
MPAVEEVQLSELVLSGKIGAITLDTTAFDRYQCNLNVRALRSLSQFRGTGTRFLLSEIVFNEVKAHISALAAETHAGLMVALHKVRKGWRRDVNMDDVDKLLGLEQSPLEFAEAFFADYANETEPDIIKVDGLVSHDEVIRRYFATEPPFSTKEPKKSEFPDALALLSLEAWASANKTLVLLVSADGDWKRFAEQSDWLVLVPELGTALDHFNLSNEIRKTVGRALEMLQKADAPEMHDEIERAIELFLEQFDPEVEAYSSLEYEIDNIDPSLQHWFLNDFDSRILFVSPDMIVFAVSVTAIVNFEGTFSYSVHDSIDRDYVSLGSDSHETEETISIPMTISMQRQIEEEPVVERIEITPIRVVIDFGSIEPNWGYEE